MLRALEQGAYWQGYPEDYWTLDRITHLIWDLFRVRYKPTGVWRLLHHLDWSCQKPQRQALHRDDEAIAHWKHYIWPQIKKWQQLRATLVFLDETGFSLVSPLKRTWAPRGQTPTIRTSIEHNERLNLIGAVCLTAGQRRIRLHLQSRPKSINGEQVILFLTYLLSIIHGPIILVWGQHPIHGQVKVRRFLESHPRIRVYAFPTAAPELNPTEFVWTQVSEHTASTAPHNGSELRANVMAGIARVRSAQRLWGCIFASALPWKRKRGGH